MTNFEQMRVSRAAQAFPLVYVARRGPDRTVSSVLLAGSPAEPGQAFPEVNRQVRLAHGPLSEHWAFGGDRDADMEDLVVLSRRGAASTRVEFRVHVLRSEVEPDAAIVVLRPEVKAGPQGAEALDCPMCRVMDATKGLWSLAGCCRYLYETNAEGDLRLHVIEGPLALIYGVGRDELEVPSFSLFLRNIIPEDRPFPAAVQRILEESGSWSGSYRVKGSDGNIRHVRHFAVRHAHQGSVFVSGLMLDESAAAYAREEASVFKLSVENSREGFAITDPKGRFTYLNQEHARLFGYRDAGELLGKEWSLLYRPAEIEFIVERVHQELDVAGFWHGHVLALRKDGTTFQQDVTVSRVANGGFVCICRDRTRELQISARLEESETMLRTLFDALPMGIVIRDEHGTRQFANGFMFREDGLGAGGTPSADWTEGADEWERKQVEADAKVLKTGKSCEFVVESVMATQRRWFRFIVFLVPASAGGVRRIGSLVMDITRQKKFEQETHVLAERRREFLEMQREFISMVSHEFRTPLTTIQGAQFLLQKLFKQAVGLSRPVLESGEKWLGLQDSALATLNKLVDQVLMLNRIEHMTGEASLDRLSPKEVISETVARFNDSMDNPRVELRNEVPPGFLASMDPGLVKAAAENLISNGLKYSGLEKPVRVRVYAEKGGWAVDVADSGRGIPPADQASLFRPFFRAGNVGTVPGTGLGLAIVQRAVSFHGGRVAFESKEALGTTFTLHFPGAAHPPRDEEALLGRVPLLGRETDRG